MLQRPRGTSDRLPSAAPTWERVTDVFGRQARLRGYAPIVTPTFEFTDLFSRTAGEATDVVQKEMYSFEDRGGDSLTLRPEGTASVVRAYLQNGMQALPQPVKLAYVVPVFRYDRPQAGRFREHYQIGAEALGDASAAVDAEVIDLLWATLQTLGIDDLALHLNSLGDADTRPAFRAALVGYFTPVVDRLCGDCRARLGQNPLRILDCKKEHCERLGQDAPHSVDFLGADARRHFDRLQELLGVLEIPFTLDHRLVRGLDYYNRSVFELVPPDGGAQSTVGGGGRYDYLAQSLGGPAVPGVGFGSGIERILLNMERCGAPASAAAGPDLFVAPLVEEALAACMSLGADLRRAGYRVELAYAAASPRAQLRRANNANARVTIILGARELAAGTAAVKPMRGGEQIEVPLASVRETVAPLLDEPA